MVWTFHFDIDLDTDWRTFSQGVLRLAFSLSNENANQDPGFTPIKMEMKRYAQL
jgi:hypothetical protein